MSIIAIPNTFTVGATIVASQHNSNFSTIYNDYNGNITKDNIAANAAIVDTQLAQILTASKVSGAALTLLPNIPAGAGLVPVANIDTGTTANKIVKLDSSAKLPAVDGSALTNLLPTFGTVITGNLVNNVYTAANDGFITIYGSYNNNGMTITIDGSNPPTTTKASFSNSGSGNYTLTTMIKSGNNYKAAGSASISVYEFWPL